MTDVRTKRSSDPSVGGETVAGKRRHASSVLDGKENVVPRGRPASSKKPRLLHEVRCLQGRRGRREERATESQCIWHI